MAGASLAGRQTARKRIMTESELLQRIALTMRQEIAPAVGAEYPKTQAFITAVVLEKLGRQLALKPLHEEADKSDMDDLVAYMNAAFTIGPVQQAVKNLNQARDDAALCALIETLYAARPDIGDGQFEQLLGRVRQTLRANINRTLEYAE